MRFILFDDYNSEDFGLLYLNKSIGAPTVKTNYISIPGGDGSLDYSEFYGGPKYDSRQLTMNFASTTRDYAERISEDSAVKNALHGMRRKVIFDDDRDFYYLARLAVGDWVNGEDGVAYLTVYGRSDPWKYAVQETVVTQRGNGTVKLRNLRMPVTPKIKCTTSAKFKWNGNSVSLSSGDNQIISGLTLGAGETSVTVETTGTVTFTYRQGEF